VAGGGQPMIADDGRARRHACANCATGISSRHRVVADYLTAKGMPFRHGARRGQAAWSRTAKASISGSMSWALKNWFA